MIGNKHLHPNARVCSMGNLASDNAFVIGTPQHTKSRQAHIYVHQELEEWTDWAISAGVDPRVIAHTQAKPTMLTKYDPDTVDINYPCARTLEMTSDILKGNEFDRWMLPLVQGVLGIGTGLELYNFCRLVDELPTLKDILANPKTVTVPTKQSYKYAAAMIISEGMNKENAKDLMVYIHRLPTDLQYFIFRSACKRNMALIAVPEIGSWATGISNKYNKAA